MFLKSCASPLQGWLRKSTEGHIAPQRCRHSPTQARRERVDTVAAHRGWSAAGCAHGSRCWRFGARCYPFPGVGCSPADVPLPAGREPGSGALCNQGVTGKDALVGLGQIQKLLLSPLGEQWSGFDTGRLRGSIRGRRRKKKKNKIKITLCNAAPSSQK